MAKRNSIWKFWEAILKHHQVILLFLLIRQNKNRLKVIFYISSCILYNTKSKSFDKDLSIIKRNPSQQKYIIYLARSSVP